MLPHQFPPTPRHDPWEDRTEYPGGVVFDPRNEHKSDELNLWRGFGVEPAKGTWFRLKYHMFDIICAGNMDQFEYLMSWIACMVQHPERQGEVAVVLKGIEGSGKGILGRALKHLLGQHGLHIANAKHLVGNFNIHLRDCVFLFADEAFFAGDKQHYGALKSLITEPSLPVDGKFMNLVEADNYLHIMMASNESWVVPASIEARRFFVLDVLPDRKDDFEYFESIDKQMENGGYAAMLYELRNLDLSQFNVRQVPQTAGLQEQKKRSLDTHFAWWVEVLQRGYVWEAVGTDEWFTEWYSTVATRLLYASYEQYGKAKGERRLLSIETFGRFLATHGYRGRRLYKVPVAESKGGMKIINDRPMGYLLGDLDEARATFLAATKLDVEWQDDEAAKADDADTFDMTTLTNNSGG
jgi:phage/plasmid-associated DNA primase